MTTLIIYLIFSYIFGFKIFLLDINGYFRCDIQMLLMFIFSPVTILLFIIFAAIWAIISFENLNDNDNDSK